MIRRIHVSYEEEDTMCHMRRRIHVSYEEEDTYLLSRYMDDVTEDSV
jgi:hypothetical protein